ncbi:hypothetical protein NSP_11220 [Nodularia spumigena CCY9414]|nr:hypothetical protein NSP_11220 [Nodularia spumigena CCY9414]
MLNSLPATSKKLKIVSSRDLPRIQGITKHSAIYTPFS